MSIAYQDLTPAQAHEEYAAVKAQFDALQAKHLKLNMARGKPGPHQMDLAMDLLKMDNYITDNGFDARNYGELEGLPEARALFADVFGVQPGEGRGGVRAEAQPRAADKALHDIASFRR